MSDFAKLKAFLEVHAQELATSSGNPEDFLRQLDNLKVYWATDDDDEARLAETTRVLRKYPVVWNSLAKQGLVQDQESAKPPVAPVASTAGSSQPSAGAAASTSESSRPVPANGGRIVENETVSPSTSDRLAIWDKKVAIGKEIVTGCLGILIVGMTLLVAFTALLVGIVKPDAWSMAKDVLLVLTGLVGVVLGYYFGRIPADARTDKAEEKAQAAQTTLDSTKAETRGILDSATRGGSGVRGSEQPADLQLTPDQRRRLEQLLGP